MMNSLKDIIERCHQRHKKPLRQRKSVATHWLYNKDYPNQYTVYCAHKYPVTLSDLEQADISFKPIRRAPGHDRGPGTFNSKKRFLESSGMKNWRTRHWWESWGMQMYTGIPSERDGARWHDLNFTYQALCAAPDAVIACIEALVNAVVNPLLTLSRSGGLRFSCRIPDYLHPSNEETRLYIYRETPTAENPDQLDVYLEILGEEGFSCWDARYEILVGNLLNPPVIDKEVLFAHIDTLRAVLHEPAAPKEHHLKPSLPPITVVPPSLGSQNLNLAKEAFLKRSFSYVGQDNGFHHWTLPGGTKRDVHVSLWENNGTVWIWGSMPGAGLPTEATPITEVWDDTGILPSKSISSALPISDRVLAVREGELSPLGIKRPSPVLRDLERTTEVYESLEKSMDQIRHVFDRNVRICGLIAETSLGKSYETESYVLSGGEICLSVPTTRLAEETEQSFEKRNLPSFARWKPRMYRWQRVKDIPVEVRMENPFQHGNVCEDPERCDALERKGGNPRVSICPQCPVYTVCQQHGYLSQSATLKQAKAQILPIPQLFLNPEYAGLLEGILEPIDDTDRLCIMDKVQADELFLECNISKDVLEVWSEMWQGSALGNFAKVLLNTFRTGEQTDSSMVKRIRATVNLFRQQEEKLIEQMCQVNVRGKVVERGITDDKTGKALARFTIQFDGGISAYIPLDDSAADRLSAKGFPFFRHDFFVLNEGMKIPMQMAQAIELGILDVGNVDSIRAFPTICKDPNWTFWHQLKRFFAYYTRDADAPVGWDGEVLQFWVPPILHPRIKRLVVMSSNLSERHFYKPFSDEGTEVIQIKPAAWLAGNRVFQIRTGNYPQGTILNYDNNWNVIGMSKAGQHFFLGIRAEIERDPSIKHAIITYKPLMKFLKGIAKKENVCFVTNFKEINEFEDGFEGARVVWIVGTPYWAPGIFWLRAQMLFGNDEEPLCYEGDSESYRYKDERVQSVCEPHIVGLLTEAVGRAGLNRLTGKTVVLISSLELPDVTNRPETLLFDWEDFEVAGGLDKLPEVIATRQRFEAERDKLTAESSREEVERVLGCSARQANRVLKRLRGGAPLRVPLRYQILSALADGEKKTAELVAAVEGYPTAVKNELRRLVDAGEIVRVKRGVYTLPER